MASSWLEHSRIGGRVCGVGVMICKHLFPGGGQTVRENELIPSRERDPFGALVKG